MSELLRARRGSFSASPRSIRRSAARRRALVPLALLGGLFAAACSSGADGEPGTSTAEALASSNPYAAAPADFDGDGKIDMSLRTADGQWQIDRAANGFNGWDETYAGYGGTNAVPVPADYDGDGKSDLALKDDAGNWSIDYAVNGFGVFDVIRAGCSGTPLPADYDGDGKADLATRLASGAWSIDLAANGFGAWDRTLTGYGDASATPLAADVDGDGKADLGVWSAAGALSVDYAADDYLGTNAVFGGFGSTQPPVTADFDGDHRADLAFFATDGSWSIARASDGYGSIALYRPLYRPPSDILPNAPTSLSADAVPADYDGDGRADLAVRDRSGKYWSIAFASLGYGAFEVMENVVDPAPPGATCANYPAGKTCSVHPFADPSLGTPAMRAYYDTLSAYGASHGFTCAAPARLDTDPLGPHDLSWLYFTTCTDTLSLRAFVGREDLGAKGAGVPETSAPWWSSVEDNVCNPCLPEAALGQVYVIWAAPLVKKKFGDPERCPSGCNRMPPGI